MRSELTYSCCTFLSHPGLFVIEPSPSLIIIGRFTPRQHSIPKTQRKHEMPAIRHSSKRKPPPDGFEDIENDLLIFSNKMKDAQNKPPPSGPRHQAQWEIFQISHQRSRYVYELYYEKEAISKKLYDWLLKNGYADAMLIAKWKKQGYEKVCTPVIVHLAFIY